MARVVNVRNENPEALLRRFKRSCEKAGILGECDRRQAYEKPSEKRKRKLSEAKKRLKKRQRHAFNQD